MSGKLHSLASLFKAQKQFQSKVTKIKVLPVDDVNWFQYHIAAMLEELGEVLKADKRWKTHRNEAFDLTNKKEEIADVFITALNLAIFSGIKPEELYSLVDAKIKENTIKWEEKNK